MLDKIAVPPRAFFVLLALLHMGTVPRSVQAADVALSKSPVERAAAISGGIPSAERSFFVPQIGPLSAPVEGAEATKFFRRCPNNDGDANFPNNARIKIVILDAFSRPIEGIAAEDICIRFNGGTPAQGFTGDGADSVIANSQWNDAPLCPDIRCIAADAPTNAQGTTYITFLGASTSNPGVGVRDPNRKWGHYDSELPVYALGIKLSGRLDSFLPNGSYVLRIKNFDVTGGLDPISNRGAMVTVQDLNALAQTVGKNNAMTYWRDFDNTGGVGGSDMNMLTTHLGHTCTFPLNP